MPNLRLLVNVIAFSDPEGTAAPRLRHVDWTRAQSVVGVSNPRTESYLLAPGEERLVFDGQRTLAVDGTTAFSVALVPNESVNYRIRRTAGTAPGFRTARTFSASGGTAALTVNADQTATLTISGGTFTGISAGDTLWLPGTEESVTSPFSVVNQGFWSVMTASAGSLVLRRVGDFNGESQSGIAITNANQIAAFSAAGVQVGDKVELVSGFAAANLGTFPVINVTSSYIDVQSVIPLAAQSGVLPTAAGILVYTSSKRWVRVEANQQVAVKVNGDTSLTQKITPWEAGEDGMVGDYSRAGPTFSLRVLNLSQESASVNIVSVE
jgi:hypothetical protein